MGGSNNRSVINPKTAKDRKPRHTGNLGSVGNLSRASNHSLSSFCTVNELEKSMSYVEKTAKKLLPILTEVKKRMIPDKKKVNRPGAAHQRSGGEIGGISDLEDDDDILVDLSKIKGNKSMKNKGASFDMKNILGYLNQGENL